LDIDIPWVADDLRDKPEERDQMLIQFKKALQSLNRPYVLIQGQGEDRFQSAIKAIQSQFAHV
jgi:nicotinamide riboside kinase